MTKFIKVTIGFKSVGAQAYPSREVFLSSDAILLVKPYAQNNFEISLKPEYEIAVKKGIGYDPRVEFSSIISPSKEVNTLFEVVKAS